jgi:copper transport protein
MIGGMGRSRPVARTWCVGALAVLAGVAMVVLGPSPPADAHAFLVRTVPTQGERLEDAPREISFEFSETFDEQSARLELTVDGRAEPVTAEREPNARVLRTDVAADRDGVYLMSWEVVAEDGHQTSGELAFGVGEAAGDIPAASSSSPAPRPVAVAAGWLFFAGLALAAGSVAAAWTRASTFRPGLLGAGLALAQVGALAAWADALVADEPTRQRLGLAIAAGAVALGLLVARLASRWPLAVAVAGAGIAWSARGHSAVANGILGAAIDTTHLLAGATWVGALAVLVIDLRRTRPAADALTVAGHYARLATILVGVLAAAGIGSAVLLLDRPSDLWDTGYGQTLAVKTGVFAGAVALAAAGRRALGRRQMARLRRVTPIEAGLLVGVLAVTAVLVNLGPPASTPAAEASLLGPLPLEGPVVRDAGLAGNLTVAVTAAVDQLRVEVIAPGGDPPEDAQVELEAELPDGEDTTLLPRPCGPGCFTQRTRWPAGTTRLTVTASGDDWQGGFHVAELDTPPPISDPVLLRDLLTRMRAVPTVEFTETTTSGPGSVVTPATFTLSGSEFVELEPWAAGTADDVQPLRDERGFRMYLPGDGVWITVWLDDQGRLVRERTVTVSHEIERDSFRYPPSRPT